MESLSQEKFAEEETTSLAFLPSPGAPVRNEDAKRLLINLKNVLDKMTLLPVSSGCYVVEHFSKNEHSATKKTLAEAFAQAKENISIVQWGSGLSTTRPLYTRTESHSVVENGETCYRCTVVLERADLLPQQLIIGKTPEILARINAAPPTIYGTTTAIFDSAKSGFIQGPQVRDLGPWKNERIKIYDAEIPEASEPPASRGFTAELKIFQDYGVSGGFEFRREDKNV